MSDIFMLPQPDLLLPCCPCW